MAPHPHRASIRSFGSAHPPPSYDTRTNDDFRSQLEETNQRHPRSTRSKLISNVIIAFTISLLLLSLVLGILLCIAGTSSSTTNNKSKILLSDYNILEIPIKYDFLCSPSDPLPECIPEWFVRVYLDGVWAYNHDPNTPDTPSSLHQIHASPGKTFDLLSILKIMDSNIPLQPSQATQNYTVPTKPVLNLTGLDPISTLPNFVNLLVSMSLTLLTAILLPIMPTILSTQPKRPVALIFALLPYIPLLAALVCNIYAIANLRSKASAAISPLHLDNHHSAGPKGHPEAHLGTPYLTLSAISIGAQGLALLSHALYIFLSTTRTSPSPPSNDPSKEEPPIELSLSTPLSPTKDSNRFSATSKKNDTPLSDEELIRMAELQTLETLQWRQSRDSISEISRQSFSRTPERRLSYVLEPPKRLVIGDEVFAAAGANGPGGHVRRGSLSRTLTHDSV